MVLDREMESKMSRSIKERMAEMEKEQIITALELHEGKVMVVAEALQMPRRTLYNKIKRYDIDPEQYRSRKDADSSQAADDERGRDSED